MGEIEHLQHIHQLVELFGHLLQGLVVPLHHHGEARLAIVFGRTNRKAVDVEAAACKEARDPAEGSGFVLHNHREGVLHLR